MTTNIATETMAGTSSDTRLQPNWRHVCAFLGLTFGLTWLLDLAIYLRGGLATAGVTTILQLQMLLPAFSAIVLGLALMSFYTTGLGIVLSYAMLKSGSVLLASFLHALCNQVAAFIMLVGFTPHDTAFSFFIGVYGIATLAVAAFLILRDPIWRGKGSNLA